MNLVCMALNAVIVFELSFSDTPYLPPFLDLWLKLYCNEFVDNFVMGKDLEIGVPRIPNLQHKDLSKEVLTNIAGNNGEKFREIKSEQDSGHLEKGQLELNSEKHNTELRNQGNDLKGVITNITNPRIESEVVDISNSLSSNKKNEVIYETKEMPSLELVLKRLRDTGDAWASANDRNVLRHSDLSAFSR